MMVQNPKQLPHHFDTSCLGFFSFKVTTELLLDNISNYKTKLMQYIFMCNLALSIIKRYGHNRNANTVLTVPFYLHTLFSHRMS